MRNWLPYSVRLWLFDRGYVQVGGRHRKLAAALLSDAIDILNDAGVPYHLDYGTLLGLYRDGDLIPWDNDLDIGIRAVNWPAFEATFPAFRARGWQVPHDENLMTDDGPGWRTGDRRRTTVVSRILLPFSIGRMRLDVVAKYLHDDHLWWFLEGNLCGAPEAFFGDHGTLDYNGRTAMIPDDPEAYLEWVYGDWRTPRRDYVASRDDGSAVRYRFGRGGGSSSPA